MFNPNIPLLEFLKENRLDRFKDKLINQGVEYVYDLVDFDFKGLTSDVGMTKIEANRTLRKREEYLSKLVDIEYYLYTKLAPEKRRKRIFNKDLITYCDLVNIICNEERNELGEDMTVELYTCEGYPLATKPISYISKLSDWCLEEYPDTPLLYAVPRLKCYTDKCTQYMTAAPLCDGTDHIFIRNEECDFKMNPIRTNCKQGTYFQLIKKIQDVTGIPGHLIQLYQAGEQAHVNSKKDVTLNKVNLSNDSSIEMIVEKKFWVLGKDKHFCLQECKPTWYQKQNIYGSTLFFSFLYSLADWMAEISSSGLPLKTLGHIRSKTQCAPLIHALNLVFRNEVLTLPHRVAIQECLFLLFEILNKNLEFNSHSLRVGIENVTENTHYFWLYLIEKSKSDHMNTERCFTFNLTCSATLRRMTDPVLVTDVHGEGHIVDRSILDVNVSCNGKLATNLFNYRRMIKSFIGNMAIVWNPVIVPIDNVSPIMLCVNYSGLHIQEPLKENISIQSYEPSMILTSNGNVAVYLGNSNDSKRRHVYFDIQTGHSILFNADRDINYRFNHTFRIQHLAKLKKEGLINPVNPEEIIMVILDTSKSMRSPYLDGKSKFNSVKEAYGALLDRLTAYNLKHIIGLTLFARQPRLHDSLSENFRKFTNNQCDILSRGKNAAIYRAIEFAVNELNIFKTQNPGYQELPSRILCLSDGGGIKSVSEATNVLRLLKDNNIIMDCVLLLSGTRKVGDTQTIANASGGSSFTPTSTEQLLCIFDQKTMLSLKIRQLYTATFASGEYTDLTAQAISPLDASPSHIVTKKLSMKVQTAKKCLTRAFIQKQLTTHCNQDLTIRIIQEISCYQSNPHPAIEVFPGKEHIDFWRIIMEGPEGTPYEGGIFELFIEFINEYPVKPPNIRFITPIYHCNINSSGRIYHPVLDRFYSPGLRVGEILIQIYELLINPQPDNLLDSTTADFLCLYKNECTQTAKNHTNSYAALRTKEEILNNLIGAEQGVHAKYPAHLVCPLTMELFEDPVTTLFGKTYERRVIKDHLKNGKKYDPLTFGEINEDDLRPNIVIKELAKHYM